MMLIAVNTENSPAKNKAPTFGRASASAIARSITPIARPCLTFSAQPTSAAAASQSSQPHPGCCSAPKRRRVNSATAAQ